VCRAERRRCARGRDRGQGRSGGASCPAERALSSVRLTEDELRARVETGSATPEERDAWQEVDTVAFLLGASAG
jgi:hypothetical protein